MPALINYANKTITTASLGPNPTVYGQSVTFTATVTAITAGLPTPTGSVEFFDGTTELDMETLDNTGTATFTTSALVAGSHALTVQYLGDSNFSGSTSLAVSQTVNQAGTTTALVGNPSPSVYGQMVTFTATVSPVAPGGGTPTGSVEFFDGTTELDTETLDNTGTASFTSSALAVGSHSITVQYLGDGNFTGNASSAFSQTVNQAATTTALAGGPSPSVFGQTVTFTATISPVAPGAGSPTGSVEFFDGTTELDTETLDNTGTASFTTSALAVGSHSITVEYLGDGNFTGNTSSAFSQTVNQAGSATSLSLSSSKVVYGQSVTFTATVGAVAPGSGTPTGSVEFFDGTTELDTADLSGGSATFGTATLAVGTHSITAQYLGDDNFTGSTSPAQSLSVTSPVGVGTTTSVVSSANPSVFGQSVTFTATVKASVPGHGTPTGTVAFLDGTSTLGTATVSAGRASFKISTLAVANNAITAVYSGDTTFAGSTSPTLNQTVNQDATRTTVTASSKKSVFGQSVTFTATVTARSPGGGTPAGQVTFMDGSTQLGNATLSGGTATLTISSLSVGTTDITVVYGRDTDFLSSTSTALDHRVNQDSTTTVISSSSNPSVHGQPVTFTATVAAAAPGGGTPTGMVTFYDGSTVLDTATLSGGVASFETSALSVGTRSITALYGGDADFNGSKSAILKQVVQSKSNAIRLVANVPPTYDEIAALPDDGMDDLLIHDLALEQVSVG